MSDTDDAWRRFRQTNPIDPEALPSGDAAHMDGYKAGAVRRPPGTYRSMLGALRPAVGVTALVVVIGAVLLLALPRGVESPSGAPPNAPSPTPPGPGKDAGSQVIADFQDNGAIDACYPDAAFVSALDRLSADAQQYGSAVNAIALKQAACSGGSEPTAGVEDSYEILRRPATGTDAPPTRVIDALPHADVARSRAVTIGATTYFVVPERRGLCLVAAPGGFACGRLPDMLSRPLVLNSLCVHGLPGQAHIAGLVTDAVTRVEILTEDGGRQEAELADNVFAIVISKDPLPTEIFVTKSDGSSHLISAGIPRDSQAVRC